MYLKELDINVKSATTQLIYSNKEALKKLKELAEKNTLEQLAKLLGVKYAYAYTLCRHNEITCKKEETAKKRVLLDEYYTKEHTIQEIAEHFNLSKNYIRILCKEQNIKYKQKEHEISYWASTFNGGKIRYVYYDMLRRCYKEKDKNYYRYGKRGITVCEEWKKDCCNFYRWAKESGYRQGLQLDRIDNDGNYEPSNCRWVTPQENSYNKNVTRRITYKGETHTLLEWEKITGINKTILADRIYKYKWDVERALTTPKKK